MIPRSVCIDAFQPPSGARTADHHRAASSSISPRSIIDVDEPLVAFPGELVLLSHSASQLLYSGLDAPGKISAHRADSM